MARLRVWLSRSAQESQEISIDAGNVIHYDDTGVTACGLQPRMQRNSLIVTKEHWDLVSCASCNGSRVMRAVRRRAVRRRYERNVP